MNTTTDDREMTVGQKIVSIRSRLGLNQTELAERTGTTSAVLSQLEAGAHKPSFDMLVKLVDALGVTCDYLLGRERLSDSSLKDKILADPMASIIFHGLTDLPENDKAMFIQYCEMVIALNSDSDRSAHDSS